MKKLNLSILLFMLITVNSFSQLLTTNQRAPNRMVPGPVKGVFIPPPTSNASPLSCVVDGVTITTSGSYDTGYYTPNSNINCIPDGAYLGYGDWTGAFDPNGFVIYTFSQPVFSVRVGYSAIDSQSVSTYTDSGIITINGISPIQLSSLCGVSAIGNVLTCNLPLDTTGDVGLTVSSATPFTSITITNTSGNSGWVTSNPCNFIIYPSPTIVNCPKISMGEMCYRASGPPNNSPFSVFNTTTNGSFNSSCVAATINGVPFTNANVTIEPITPMPFGCTFNPNGTINIPNGTNPFSASIYYRFRSIANPAIFSETYRADFGINNRITTANYNISLTAANPVYNGSTNILTSCSRQNNIGGFCVNDGASATNVTFSDTTSPPNLYWTINTAGNVVLRPGVVITNTVPPLPQTTHELTYNMCITGSTVWCNTGKVVITYGYPMNKPATNSNNLEKAVIAPNPSSDGIFSILFDTIVKVVTIEVYNNIGQKMYEAQTEGTNEHLLVVDRLPKGTYVLKLKDGNQAITKNIVKQ
jgi:hypothetical protein